MIRLLLAERMSELGMTQAQLSKKTGIRTATINELYWNESRAVNLEQLELICEALNCDLCDIMTMHYKELKALEHIIRRGDIAGAFARYLEETGENARTITQKLSKMDAEPRRLAMLFSGELVAAEERKHKKHAVKPSQAAKSNND